MKNLKKKTKKISCKVNKIKWKITLLNSCKIDLQVKPIQETEQTSRVKIKLFHQFKTQ